MKSKKYPMLSLLSIPVWLLILLLCTGRAVYGQDRNGLFENNILRADTSEVLSLLKKAKETSARNPDSALILATQTLQQSRTLAFGYGIALSLFEQGKACAALEQNKEAEQAYRSSLPYFMASERGKRELPHVISHLGRLFVSKADYEKAIQYYYQSIDMADKMEPPVNVDYVYNNLAAVLTQIGRETQSAWYYLEKAEKSAIGHKDFVLLTKVMNNKGFACNARKMWDSSLYYFNRSLQLSRKQQLQEAEYLALMNIAIVLLEQKKPEKALPYLQQAQQIQGHVHPAYKNMLYGALGLTYLLLGDYKKAEPLLLAEYNGAVARNNRSNMKEAHYNLYRLYGATKDYQKAYEHANGYITINNTIGGDEIIRNVNQEEVRFRTAEKDQDLLEKRLIIEKQEKSLERKNRWISIIVSSAIIFLLLVFVVVKSYHNRQKMMKQKMSNLQQQKEIERLKANIEGEESERTRIARELHDGIGGLISAAQLNMRTLGKESPGIKASETFRSTTSILEEAAGELRKTAHNMMPSVLLRQNMEGAITAFCNYIRQGRQLAIDVQCYGNFETLPDSYRIAIYRIVQELSNNVAKHSEATAALVQLMFQQPVMSITIEDNGKGFDPDNILNKKNGMGLKNVMERVKSMNGTISLDTMPGKGTSVYIELEIPGAVP